MNKRINEKVGAWLLVPGHTQELLAEELSMTRPTLRNRLNGQSEWMWGEVIKIAELTNSTLDEMAGISPVS